MATFPKSDKLLSKLIEWGKLNENTSEGEAIQTVWNGLLTGTGFAHQYSMPEIRPALIRTLESGRREWSANKNSNREVFPLSSEMILYRHLYNVLFLAGILPSSFLPAYLAV